MSGMLRSTLLFSVFITLLSTQAAAISCYEESPAHAKEGDKYYELTEERPLTRKERKLIQQFFSSFPGTRLEGHSEVTDCVGTEKSARKRVSKEKLKGKMTLSSSGELELELHLENPVKKTTYDETTRYFTGDRLFEIKKIDKDRMIVESKYRSFHYAGKGSQLVEDIIVFKRNGNTLSITTTRYIGGYFAVELKRTLHH